MIDSSSLVIVTYQTATALQGRRDKLIRVLGRIENVLMRLEICIELPRTSGMTDATVKVLAEVLYILAVATKEIKENLASKSIYSDRSAPSTHYS